MLVFDASVTVNKVCWRNSGSNFIGAFDTQVKKKSQNDNLKRILEYFILLVALIITSVNTFKVRYIWLMCVCYIYYNECFLNSSHGCFFLDTHHTFMW